MSQKAQTPLLLLQFLFMMQEWNEIQFNGVYYNPSKKGKLAHPWARKRKHHYYYYYYY